jgi:Esterase/lipase
MLKPHGKDGPGGVPVLFIPGNAGSSRQVRSIASSATRQFYSSPYVVAPAFQAHQLKPLDFFAGMPLPFCLRTDSSAGQEMAMLPRITHAGINAALHLDYAYQSSLTVRSALTSRERRGRLTFPSLLKRRMFICSSSTPHAPILSLLINLSFSRIQRRPLRIPRPNSTVPNCLQLSRYILHPLLIPPKHNNHHHGPLHGRRSCHFPLIAIP